MNVMKSSRPPLDEDCAELIRQVERGGSMFSKPDHHQMRAGYNAANAVFNPPHTELRRVEDVTIPGDGSDQPAVPIRIYRPDAVSDPAPAIVFYHGGGWVLGDLESHDAMCRILAKRSDAVVIAVDYRLAPEHPFPAGLEDCELAWNHLHAHADRYGIDPDRMAMGGDSAGGNLTAATCQRLKRDGGPLPVLQVLIYPATDFTASGGSLTENGSGYFLTKDQIDAMAEMYLGDRDNYSNPDASPLLCEDLSALPPALVQIAGYDPLRDEGVAYAGKLREAGVHVDLIEYPSVVHGFMRMLKPVAMAQVALDDAAAALRRAFREA
ncbi:MAG: alpha/beta hydrolase [Minwuia sp.]|uniref:alpha/beta hydrolase n=1 Tax=Minwuia sp. TaxID=2493630 RepID=UPI003A8B8A38